MRKLAGLLVGVLFLYSCNSGAADESLSASTPTTPTPTPASASHTLTVTVVEGSGIFVKPLRNVSVTVNGVNKKSGIDGKALMNATDGNVTVSVVKAGYTDVTISTTISGSDKDVTVTMILSRTPSSAADTWSAGTGWSLDWSDEFTAPALDAGKWVFQVEGAGAFNGELQSYTSSTENCFVTNRSDSDGMLVVQAVQTGTEIKMGDFTSARIHTHGKKDFRYGKIAARIQMPFGKGIWPAFWMLGSNISENAGGTVSWPQCGEIDIMEKKGGDATKEKTQMGALHYWNGSAHAYWSKSYVMASALSEGFHVYEVEWNSATVIWRIDGIEFYRLDTTPAVYDAFRENFYILLNLAVGGMFDGNPDASSVFPQFMYVDWVRIYKLI